MYNSLAKLAPAAVDEFFKTLLNIEVAQGTNAKKQIFSAAIKNHELKEVFCTWLHLAYESSYDYGIRPTVDDYALGLASLVEISNLKAIDEFLTNMRTGNRVGGKHVYKKLLLESPAAENFLFYTILARGFKSGISCDTMEELLGTKLLTRYSLQACNSITTEKLEELLKANPGCYRQEVKLDGVRATVSRIADKLVWRSRSNHPLYNTKYIDEYLLRTMPDGYTLDGELIIDEKSLYAHNLSPKEILEISVSVVSSLQPNDYSRNLVYYVYDILPTEEFAQRKCSENYDLRYKRLASHFVSSDEPSCKARMVPSIVPATYQEAMAFHENIVNNGGEGSIFKHLEGMYTYERTDDWLKFKPVYDVDCLVVDVELATVVKNYHKNIQKKYNLPSLPPMVKSLIVEYNGVLTSVGGGISDELRYKWGINPRDIIGKLVVVECKQVNTTGVLREPVYSRIKSLVEV